MLRPRSGLAVLCLAGFTLGAPTPALAAKGPKGPTKQVLQKYRVTFTAKRTVSWEEPAFSGYEDCSYKTFGEAHGKEVADLHTRAPVKMVVFRNAYNPTIQARFGTWSIGSEGRDGTVDGKIEREASRRVWYEGGECGEAPPQPEPEPDDCGVREPTFSFEVGVTNNKVGVNLVRRNQRGSDDPMTFDTCELQLPEGLTESLDPEPKAIQTKRFLRPGGGITVTFHKTYAEQAPAGARPWTRSGEMTWKVTFTPVKR